MADCLDKLEQPVDLDKLDKPVDLDRLDQPGGDPARGSSGAGYATPMNDDSAATSTGAWLAHATTQPRGKAHADVTLATALDQTYPATRAALATGHVDGDQARVIVAAVQRLHEDAADALAADPSIPQRAEKHLLGLAGDYDAKALKALGRHVFEVLDPDAADTALGQKLQAQEQAAARKTYLELFDHGDGTTRAGSRSPPCTPRCSAKPSRPSPTPPTGISTVVPARRAS